MKRDLQLTEAGAEIVAALTDFLDAIREDRPIAERFAVTTRIIDRPPPAEAPRAEDGPA